MWTNNQSKPKSNKNIPLRYGGVLKKSPCKDNKPLWQVKGNQHNIVSREKSKTHKKKQKYQSHSKSKKKKFEAKEIHQEYYIQQKRQQYLIKGCNEQLQKNQQKSKFVQINQFQFKNLGKDVNDCKIRNKLQKINQFCLPQYRKVLNIQGKFIKMPPKGYTELLYHKQTNFQGFQEVEQQKYKNFRDKKFKTRPRQKSLKHLRSKSRQNIKSKVREKHCKSQQNITIQKQNLLIQQTQISPLKQKEYLRQQKFDFQQIAELIQQDIKFCNQIKINSTLDNIRKQCMKLMSQICGEISLRRQTFYLAMSIFDRTISKKIAIEDYKLLVLVSLTLAMKLEQARRAEQFIYVLKVVNTGKQSYIQSISSFKSSSKSKQIQKKSHQLNDRSIINKKQNSFKTNIKQQNLKKISISAIAKILKKHNCSKIQKFDFMDLQKKVTFYLRFRLWRIQAIFWADLLTCLWDQHIIANKQNVLQNYNLFFRSSLSLTNIHYLYQILQMAYIDKKVYSYPSIHIVLSAIYLLVRIAKQNDDKGYQYYRQSLANSTNILFVDKTGINQIYWLFLDKIKIQMVEILACCQFISNFLQPSLLKSPSIFQDLGESIDNKLSLHQFNPDLYLQNN